MLIKNFVLFTLRDGAKNAPPQGERAKFLSCTEVNELKLDFSEKTQDNWQLN
jgi:hypothetical protein